MKPIGCIIYMCVSSLHAQRMSNIFSLIVPLYYIGCLLFTHNTQNTQNPPPSPPIHQRLYELYLWRTSYWRTYKFSGSVVVHTFFKSYTLTGYGDFLWTAFLSLDIIFYDLDKSIWLNLGITVMNICILNT